MSECVITAKALKKDGQLVPFDPDARDATSGYFVAIQQVDGILLVIDEGGGSYHMSIVAALRRLGEFGEEGKQQGILPDNVIQTIRGGTYAKNVVKLFGQKRNWHISMWSGDFGTVWPEIQKEVVNIISGGRQWE